MKKDKRKALLPQEIIESKIYLIRGKRVMLDRDLAALYSVETRILNQSVQRNKERFPDDFMFQLNKEEMDNWISQIVISNRTKKGIRKRPFVFTQEGVAMLSSVLRSKRAICINVQIMRTFVKIRELIATHRDLREKIEKLETKIQEKCIIYDKQFKIVFKAFEDIKRMLTPPHSPKRRIGFHGN